MIRIVSFLVWYASYIFALYYITKEPNVNIRGGRFEVELSTFETLAVVMVNVLGAHYVFRTHSDLWSKGVIVCFTFLLTLLICIVSLYFSKLKFEEWKDNLWK